MIAAQYQSDHSTRAFHEQGLDGLLWVHFQEPADLLDAVLSGRVHGLHRLAGRRALAHRRQRLGHLHVGGVIALRADGNRVLAGIGEHVEFVRMAAADGAGVGRDRAELQPHAAEDARVGFVHRPIGFRERGLADMK